MPFMCNENKPFIVHNILAYIMDRLETLLQSHDEKDSNIKLRKTYLKQQKKRTSSFFFVIIKEKR